MLTKFSFLLAAGVLSAGVAAAQNVPNTRPVEQGRGNPGEQAMTPANTQRQQTLRQNALDNQSFVSQAGNDNYGAVDQSGDRQVADMVQVSSFTPFGTAPDQGNDGYQTQSNGTNGGTGRNTAYMAQYGAGNYGDQVQTGTTNVATALQGRDNAGRNGNYLVQEQTGANNYEYVTQESNNNFAHQRQTSDGGTPAGGGMPNSSSFNGNYAVTRQGGGSAGGANGTDNQWSQTIQFGQNNRAVVSQDHQGSQANQAR